MIEITERDIKRVEDIFFNGTGTFEDEKGERYAFISCIDRSIDVEACPGSGKTTSLLAKIFLLAEKLANSNGKGICVLTHTNVAIDEIKKNLGKKASLVFQYPNFFGTIQSFVDKYLAIPWYCEKFKRRPAAIDTQLVADRLKKSYLDYSLRDQVGQVKYFLTANKLYDKITFKRIDSGGYGLVNGINGEEVKLKTPNNRKEKWSRNEKNEYTKILRRLRFSILEKSGLISYDDAYFLAKEYLIKHPQIKKAISSRFSHVFIDEMQDTYDHQNEIINEIFDENVIIQRIGDSNQAILNDNDSESAWEPSERLTITGSRRFSQPIANVLKTVALKGDPQLTGYRDTDIPPYILTYEPGKEGDVLEKFATLVQEYEIDKIEDNDYPIKAVGWVGKDKPALTIKSYFPSYSKTVTKKKSSESLKSAILHCNTKKPGEFYNVLLDCCLEILRLSDEKIETPRGNRFHTKTSFLAMLKGQYRELLVSFSEKISEWGKELNIITLDEVIPEIRTYLVDMFFPVILAGLGNESLKFIRNDAIEGARTVDATCINTFFSNQDHLKHIPIKVGTVHSVKGETHRATLYLETKYYKNCGDYLIDELIGKSYDGKGGSRKERCMKVAHVGMSRPTHLLCVALNRELVMNHKAELENNGWAIR